MVFGRPKRPPALVAVADGVMVALLSPPPRALFKIPIPDAKAPPMLLEQNISFFGRAVHAMLMSLYS